MTSSPDAVTSDAMLASFDAMLASFDAREQAELGNLARDLAARARALHGTSPTVADVLREAIRVGLDAMRGDLPAPPAQHEDLTGRERDAVDFVTAHTDGCTTADVGDGLGITVGRARVLLAGACDKGHLQIRKEYTATSPRYRFYAKP